MKSYSIKLASFTLAVLLSGAYACKKPAGPGGRATVKGKIYVNDFDNTQHYLLSQHYGSGEKVYICYGTNDVVGNNVETAPDGSYAFLYLNKGHYKVFSNSLDTSIKTKGNKTLLPVVREFDITGTSQTVTLDDIIINR